MRVALYRRVHGNAGLAAQQSYIQHCLNRHPDWEVVAEYDDAGVKAYAAVRPGLMQLLADAAEHKFDVALAQSAVRFSPDNIKVLKLANELSRAGVDIKFANGIDYELLPIPKEMNKAHQGLRNRGKTR